MCRSEVQKKAQAAKSERRVCVLTTAGSCYSEQYCTYSMTRRAEKHRRWSHHAAKRGGGHLIEALAVACGESQSHAGVAYDSRLQIDSSSPMRFAAASVKSLPVGCVQQNLKVALLTV